MNNSMNGLIKMSACCVLAMSAPGQDWLLAAPPHVLANEKISVSISDAGTLNSVENLLAAETYSFSFSSDAFTLETCLACDDFYDWWLMVQNNTIQKYNLSNWSWDPSLGSGMNCHDESHGHFAGKGGYKGWRRGVELMARMKAASPGLFIQGFYGTKNFGLWGLKNVDQHEVLNEQSIIVSTRHHQISDDRQNADGLRFQNNWSMRFRFTPAVMGHALTHRVSEGNFDPELIKAWDYSGWQYGVMSALAVSGSIMPTILPYEADLVPGFVEFYKKWQRWAKDTFEYVKSTNSLIGIDYLTLRQTD